MVQEIPVHGNEPAKTDDRAQGEDPGYSKDFGHGAVP